MLNAQRRFASTMKKTRSKANKTTREDIVLSDEMSSWLDSTFESTDEDGYYPDFVGSSLTQPLDSFSAFCPTGSLLKSKFSSLKVPSSNMNDTDESVEQKFDFKNAVSRLDVMWLNRKAKLEKEDGNYDESLNALQQALDIHLGSQKYEECRISEPAGVSDPEELMLVLEDNFFPFDSSAHHYADRIQRWYHRYFMVKARRATSIQRCYRSYIRRRNFWRRLKLRTQCALLIQRRFRHHLKRMNRLATLIKSWYRMRIKMREYAVLMRFYRAARKLQRLQRGIWGRAIANQKRLELRSCILIQYNFRGYSCRQQRSWALRQLHRVMYNAALRIQCFARRLIAVTRCKRRLMEELVREEHRQNMEKAIRDETIQIESARTKLYLLTDAGKIHLEACKKKIVAQDEEFNRIKHQLSPEDVLAHDAMVIFEVYDSDGSGSIDIEELKLMLLDLCVPIDKNELDQLAHDLDCDGSGDIDFVEFAEWYTNGGGNDASNSVSGMLFKQMLKARRLVLDMTGETLRRRSERAVLRQCCSWLSNEAKALFRISQPPKYNCCRCLEPFVLFTDYLRHFKGKGDNRLCSVTGERALFYTKFWVQRDWLKQRQCEAEVMRAAYEYPSLSYNSMMAVYAELAIMSNPFTSGLLQNQIAAAAVIYKDVLSNSISSDETSTSIYDTPLSEHVYNIANLCNDGFLSPNIAKCIASCLSEDLPLDWLMHDIWTFPLFREWLANLDCLKRENVKARYCSCCHSRQKIVRQDANLLGNIYVRCVRLLLVGVECSLISLTEYRLKRPRRMTISDSELKLMKLSMLTKERHDNIRLNLLKRLRTIRESVRKLQVVAISLAKSSRRRGCLNYLKNILGVESQETSVIDEDIDDEVIEEYEYENVHTRAEAQYRSRLTTKVGKTHLRRTDCELWAKRKSIDVDHVVSRISSLNSTSDTRRQLEYLCCIFCSSALRSNSFHIRDLDMLFKRYLCLDIPPEEKGDIISVLDPHSSGFVELDSLFEWLCSPMCMKYFSRKLYFKNIIMRGILKRDAKCKMLCDYLRIGRLEIEAQKQSLRAIDALLNSANGSDSNIKSEVVQEDGAVSFNEILKNLRLAVDKQEQLVLARIAEDEAEVNTKLRMIFTSKGRYFLKMETVLMQLAQEMIYAYGEFVPSTLSYPTFSRSGNTDVADNNIYYSMCLAILIHCFDTDCSGNFDESEVTLLLKCVKNSLAEKKILYHFPDVMHDSSSLHQVLTFLLPRVKWTRKLLSQNMRFFHDIKISTKSHLYSSSLLLVSLARQHAREKCNQAAHLTKTGILLDTDNSADGNVSEGLLMRSQLLAMRQVKQFLKTPFGKIRLLVLRKSLQFLWDSVIGDQYSRLSLFRYAFLVHQIDSKTCISESPVVLNTEIPHIIRFISLRMNLNIKSGAAKTLAALSQCKSESDARWISLDEAIGILDRSCEPSETIDRSAAMPFLGIGFAKTDAQCRMMSLARQQALLIAIDYPEKDVKETNYRCFILGLYTLKNIMKRKLMYSSSSISWNAVPKEAMLVYLLSHGFSMHDLIHPSLVVGGVQNKYVVQSSRGPFYQADDAIRSVDIVNPRSLLEEAVSEIFPMLGCVSSVDRLCRYMGGVGNFLLYKKIVVLLTCHRDEVNFVGRMFLDEIIVGISHCNFR